MEIIESIEFVSGVSVEGCIPPMEGIRIKTQKQIIELFIGEYGDCCEDPGYFISEDKIADFIGAHLIDIKLVDTALNLKKLSEELTGDSSNFDTTEQAIAFVDGGDIIFVNLETSKGTLQFVAYCEQNGYYGVKVYIKSEQLKHEAYI